MNAVTHEHFNVDHWMRVFRERKRLGLSNEAGTNVYLDDHPLMGATLCKQGKEYTVVKVYRQWWQGWYLAMIAHDANDSSAVIWWENINSGCPIVIQKTARAQRQWTVVKQ